MYYVGFLFGVFLFLLVGLCHPLVAWVEYRFGRRYWVLFAALGVLLLLLSVVFRGYASLACGALSASCLWSALEVRWQHQRACQGRAKRNPSRPSTYYQS